MDVFAERMKIIPRVLNLQNRRRGALLDEQEIEDLAQDTMALVWSKLDVFAGQSSLESWVYPFCLNTMANAVRKKVRRTPALELQADEPQADAPAAAASDRLGYDEVHAALARLGPPRADVIRLKYFDGLTFAEIARRLSVPLDTAKTWYYRGLQFLKEQLQAGAREVEA